MTRNSTAEIQQSLPQVAGKHCITDGGLETVFVFQKNIELPLFAAFTLLDSKEGMAALKDYYLPYIELALRYQTGLVLDTPTWRASNGWGRQLGYHADDMRQINRAAVRLVTELRDQYQTADTPIVINGVVGPQDDGYQPSQLLTAEVAEAYHQHQVDVFAASNADMVSAITMTYAAEAIGIARAARQAGLPVAISFTVETDGLLPDGSTLGDAIRKVDSATGNYPAYFMINCAHPTHFAASLDPQADWLDRVYGIRANASCKSHAELDEATELDEGNPVELGQWYAELGGKLKNLRVVGGCCGTDHRHVGEICRAYLAAA